LGRADDRRHHFQHLLPLPQASSPWVFLVRSHSMGPPIVDPTWPVLSPLRVLQFNSRPTCSSSTSNSSEWNYHYCQNQNSCRVRLDQKYTYFNVRTVPKKHRFLICELVLLFGASEVKRVMVSALWSML